MTTQNTEENKGTMAETNEVPTMNVDTDTPVLVDAKAQEAEHEDTSSNASDENSEFTFTRKAVEGLGKAVHLVDSDPESGLDLFCYVKCSNTDDEILKKCRGVVFHDSDLVLKAFPFTADYNHSELPLLEEALQDFSKFSFYDAHEGALIRVFNFNGKWFLTTHRKLNAFRSKWASRESFGTHFKNALEAEVENNKELKAALPDGENILERFYSILDPAKQYMFLVLNGADNRIVCQPPSREMLFHVGTFVDGELDMDYSFCIPQPKKHSWLNIDELIHYVDNIDYTQLQGVIGFGPDNTQLKIFHKVYQDLFRTRGNEASIKFRYLQIRMNAKFTDMLYYLYPEHKETFEDYEDTIYDIAHLIYNAYRQRFIKKHHVTVPREEFQVVKECHDWHLADRSENRISLNKVISVLNKQPPTALNHMIRRFKTEQAKRTEQQQTLRFPRQHKGSRNNSVQNSPAINALNSTPIESPLLLGKLGRMLPPHFELGKQAE